MEKGRLWVGYQHAALPVKAPLWSISEINPSFIRARSSPCDLWEQPISHYGREGKNASALIDYTNLLFKNGLTLSGVQLPEAAFEIHAEPNAPINQHRKFC